MEESTLDYSDNTNIIEAAIQLSIREKAKKETPLPEKKRPGRPKKKLDIHEMCFFGIADKPLIEGADIELVYSNPALFRNITAMFKSYMTKDVIFRFDASGLTLYSKSHSSETSIYAQLDGASLNYYYYNSKPSAGCQDSDSVTFLMSQLTMERVFLNLSENEYIIAITFNHATPESIDIVLRDLPYQNTAVINVTVAIPLDPFVPLPKVPLYPLTFQLSHDYLKSCINSIQKLGDTIIFQKTQKSSLNMTVNGRSSANIKTTFNEKAVRLETHGLDKTLIAMLQIEQLRPFASNNKGETVTIALDYSGPAMFYTVFDTDNGSPATVAIIAKLRIPDMQ